MTRSGLSMVLSGQRDLTIQQTHAIARALRMNDETHQEWEALVQCTQSKCAHSRSFYKNRLQKIRVQNSETRKELIEGRESVKRGITLRSASGSLVSSWYTPAVLVYLLDHGESERCYENMSKSLNLPVDRIRSLVSKLKSEGFLNIETDGSVHIAFERISSSLSMQRYLLECLDECKRRVRDSFDDSSHFFTTHQFSIPKDKSAAFIKDVKSIFERYVNAEKTHQQTSGHGDSENSSLTDTVLASFQFFPVISASAQSSIFTTTS